MKNIYFFLLCLLLMITPSAYSFTGMFGYVSKGSIPADFTCPNTAVIEAADECFANHADCILAIPGPCSAMRLGSDTDSAGTVREIYYADYKNMLSSTGAETAEDMDSPMSIFRRPKTTVVNAPMVFSNVYGSAAVGADYSIPLAVGNPGDVLRVGAGGTSTEWQPISSSSLTDLDGNTSIDVDTTDDGLTNTIVFANNGSPTAMFTDFGTLAIGTTTPDPDAILDLFSNTKALLLPRMTTPEMNAIPTPTNGMVIFNTDTGKIHIFDGTAWQAGASGAGTGDVIGPTGAIDSNLAAFDTTTGKLIKDSLIPMANVVTKVTAFTEANRLALGGGANKTLVESDYTVPVAAGNVGDVLRISSAGGAAQEIVPQKNTGDVGISANILMDVGVPPFGSVLAGDIVHLVSGTNVIPGDYTVVGTPLTYEIQLDRDAFTSLLTGNAAVYSVTRGAAGSPVASWEAISSSSLTDADGNTSIDVDLTDDGAADIITFSNNSSETARFTADGRMGIGTATPAADAILDLTSDSKAFLLPRLTDAAMLAIATPVNGMQVYNTDNKKVYFYNGSGWEPTGVASTLFNLGITDAATATVPPDPTPPSTGYKNGDFYIVNGFGNVAAMFNPSVTTAGTGDYLIFDTGADGVTGGGDDTWEKIAFSDVGQISRNGNTTDLHVMIWDQDNTNSAKDTGISSLDLVTMTALSPAPDFAVVSAGTGDKLVKLAPYTLPMDIGTDGFVLTTDGAGATTWEASGNGDVLGPASATSNTLAMFADDTGKVIKESTFSVPSVDCAEGEVLQADANGDFVCASVTSATGAQSCIIDNDGVTAVNDPGMATLCAWSTPTRVNRGLVTIAMANFTSKPACTATIINPVNVDHVCSIDSASAYTNASVSVKCYDNNNQNSLNDADFTLICHGEGPSGGTGGGGGGGGSGDVVGPASSVTDYVPAFADTTGKLLKESIISQYTDGSNSMLEVRAAGVAQAVLSAQSGGTGGSLGLGSTFSAHRNLIMFQSNARAIYLYSPANILTDYNITLPEAAPAANQIMESDASGILSWIATPASDARLKKNISPMERDFLADIMALTPSTFEWTEKIRPKGTQRGLIAQEVQRVIPEAVYEKNGGTLDLNDRALIATLIGAMKQQQKEIEELKIEIQELKK